jgi:hypothetical protein
MHRTDSSARAPHVLGLLSTAVLLALGSSARGYIVAYEGFDYPVGTNLHNQTGGFGWEAPWVGLTTNDNTQIVSGSFTYNDGFGNSVTSQTGNRVHLTGNGTADQAAYGLTGNLNGNSTQQPIRRLDDDFGRFGSSTTWMSCMALRVGQPAAPPFVHPGGASYQYGRAVGVQLFFQSGASTTNSGNELASIGRATANAEPNTSPADTWGLVYRGSGAFSKASSDSFTTPTNANSTADFILARVDHVNGLSNPRNDTISVWINPRLDNEALLGAPTMVYLPTDAPTSGSDADRDFAFNFVRLFGGNINATVNNYGAIQVDEIKIGTDFNSVTLAPLPEPASLALIGLGGLVLGRRNRRYEPVQR